MTLYSAFRNYFNFQVSHLVFRFSFLRNMYVFTRFFNWIKYHWKFEQVAEAVSCKNLLCACSFIKKIPAKLFPVILGKFFRTPVLKNILAHQLLKLFHSSFVFIWIVLTQLTFTYSKSTIEALEKSLKYIKR